MRDRYQAGTDKVEVFHGPRPYDLLKLSTFFDDRELDPPPRTYIPAVDPEQQLKRVTYDLKETFGEHLLFVGLTGSMVVGSEKKDADLDVIVVVDDGAVGEKVPFEGDLKIVPYTALREFIDCGFHLIVTQFRKAQPLFEQEGRLDDLRTLKPMPEKAISFLVTKSKFNEQTADIFRLMSDRYRAIYLYLQGFQGEAFAQLTGVNRSDASFKSLQEDLATVDNGIYSMLARYYAVLGLNKMFQSLQEMAQALHVKETGDILDMEELIS